MISVSYFTTWATGIFNGYKVNEGGIPSSLKYGIMGLTSGLHAVKALGNISTIKSITPKPMAILVGVFLVVPVITGSIFCVGHQFGKVIKYVETNQTTSIKYKLM